MINYTCAKVFKNGPNHFRNCFIDMSIRFMDQKKQNKRQIRGKIYYFCFRKYEPYYKIMKHTLTSLISLLLLYLSFQSTSATNLYSSDRLSSNMFTCMVQDKTGYIWIGTEFGLNKFDGYRFTNYLHSDADLTSLPNNVVVSLFVDKNGNVIVGTNKGLVKYNNAANNFEKFKMPHGEQPRISEIIQLHDGTVLAGTEGYGLYQLNFKSMTMIQNNHRESDIAYDYFTLMCEDRYHDLWNGGHGSYATRYTMRKEIWTLVDKYATSCGAPVKYIKDPDGNMILVCQHGLMKYDKVIDKLVNVSIDNGSFNLNDIVFNRAFIDDAKNIFLGSIGNGLFYIPFGSNKLVKYETQKGKVDLSSTDVRTIFEDKENNLWVGCNYKGLLFFNKEKSQFDNWSLSAQGINIGSFASHLCEGDNGDVFCTVQYNIFKFDARGKIYYKPNAPKHTNSIYRDKSGNYWIGTDNSLFKYSSETGSSKLEKVLRGIMINTMTDDGHGTLYISTFSQGLCAYNTVTGSIKTYDMLHKNYRKGYLTNNWIVSLMVDSKGMLWIGHSAGVSCFSPRENRFNHFGWNSILTNTLGETFCETLEGNILIGTDAGLYIFDRSRNKVDYFPGSEQLRNKIICGIVYDKNGNIWCSSSMGLWEYVKRERRFISYVKGNGLSAREYYKGVYLKARDGRVFFGTSDGLTTFYPERIGNNQSQRGEVKLTNLFIGGKTVNSTTFSNGVHTTDKAVDEADRFTFSYLDNTFTMEFSLLDYSHAENIHFEYKLSGSDTWSQTEDGSNAIMFNHLQPGSYILEVKAFDNGIYSPVKIYHIIITSPWYSSTFAYFVYLVLIVSILLYALSIYNRRRHQELYEEKMQFLINTTHDIRSPLTMILGPLQKLISKGFDNETNEELSVINRNAQRILRLVNQILDIRKFDKNQMQLRCEKTVMASYIANICKNYELHAKETGINFIFEHDEDNVVAWIDRVNFDKVITNLLSNAFKYTHEGGDIKIVLSTDVDTKLHTSDGRCMKICIYDNGIGLNKTKTEKIFDRFYQGDNSRNIGIQGTGIGLNLCKMIVEMHHGTIRAENRLDTTGSCFIVTIPLGKEHLKEKDLLNSEEDSESTTGRKIYGGTRKHRILIVDDDVELGTYISGELSSYFRFTIKSNGKQALDEILKNNYDLVISDVIMPEMDGFTLVKMIKANPNISHIPVILLSSKTGVDYRLEGIEKGADAYIAKPFSMEELHVTIDNLMKNMQRLRGKFSGALIQEERIKNKNIDSNNDLLMDRIMKFVNENLSNSDYSIEQMASDIGLSRAQLHRKMKEITGVSSSDFVRNLRMQQAAKLLKEHKVNISQVAYAVGFTNEAHFSTVFRKHFGIPPSEFISKNGNNTFR